MLITWQDAVPTRSADAPIKALKKARTSGMRAMFPEKTKNAQNVSKSA